MLCIVFSMRESVEIPTGLGQWQDRRTIHWAVFTDGDAALALAAVYRLQCHQHRRLCSCSPAEHRRFVVASTLLITFTITARRPCLAGIRTFPS